MCNEEAVHALWPLVDPPCAVGEAKDSLKLTKLDEDDEVEMYQTHDGNVRGG